MASWESCAVRDLIDIIIVIVSLTFATEAYGRRTRSDLHIKTEYGDSSGAFCMIPSAPVVLAKVHARFPSPVICRDRRMVRADATLFQLINLLLLICDFTNSH